MIKWMFKLLFGLVLRMKPGDVLVLKVDRGYTLTGEHREQLMDIFYQFFDWNKGYRLLIIDGLSIYRVLERSLVEETYEVRTDDGTNKTTNQRSARS